MFEYMSASLPIIASDFPLWREIVIQNDCGILVDPLNPVSIASAIDYLIDNQSEAIRMGENGRNAIETKYSWSNEAQKLFRFYDSLIMSP